MPTPLALFAMILFPLIGFMFFKEGKREGNLHLLLLGLALISYSYFIDQEWLLWAIGATLTTIAFKIRP